MKYKIVYFAFVGANFGGVEQKIIAQFDTLRSLGADIHLFLISKFVPGKTLSSEIEKRTDVEVLINASENLSRRWAHRKEKFDLITSTLSNYAPQNTIVYFRYPIADLFFLRFLKRNKAFRFVTEHQVIENTIAKGKFKGRFLRNTLEFLWGKPVRRMITGFVGVTSEITAFERSLVGDKGHYFETIGNGIDINRYPLRIQKNDSKSNEIRLLFIGSGYRIHGLDRLIKSIDLYYRNGERTTEIHLKIAGYSIEMKKTKDLVQKLGLSSNIEFLGNLETSDLNELFNWAQIGVASLGLHRIPLSKSSTLKVREYFIRGLPFFWSSVDDDFSNNYPYILHFEPEDSLVDIYSIISFVERIKLDDDHPQKMRNYAVEHLDWSVKMKKLIAFLDMITWNDHE